MHLGNYDFYELKGWRSSYNSRHDNIYLISWNPTWRSSTSAAATSTSSLTAPSSSSFWIVSTTTATTISITTAYSASSSTTSSSCESCFPYSIFNNDYNNINQYYFGLLLRWPMISLHQEFLDILCCFLEYSTQAFSRNGHHPNKVRIIVCRKHKKTFDVHITSFRHIFMNMLQPTKRPLYVSPFFNSINIGCPWAAVSNDKGSYKIKNKDPLLYNWFILWNHTILRFVCYNCAILRVNKFQIVNFKEFNSFYCPTHW